MTHSCPNIKNTKLGFLGKFAFIVLIFSVARGVIPLLTNNANLARPTYTCSFVLCALFSLFGLHLALVKKNQMVSKQLRLLLIVNLALCVFWWIPVIIFSSGFNFKVTIFYMGLFPFAIFGFVRLPEKYLVIALITITLLVAGTIIWDFIELNTTFISNGYDLAIKRQLLLRPESFMAFGNTAGLMRPVGILGPHPHDAGNLLAILSVYWVAMLLREDRIKIGIFLIFVIAVIGMLMTQSASNIVAFFVGILFIIGVYRKKILKFTKNLRIFPSILVVLIIIFLFTKYLGIKVDMLWQWSKRISPEGAWGDMMAFGITDIGRDFFVALTGHGSSLELSKIGDVSEIGFVKLLMELGLISWIIFLIILVYPIWYYALSRSKNKQMALPYIAALLVGFISLWHYGSVLRTTNEFVFLALYACALRILAKEYLPKFS